MADTWLLKKPFIFRTNTVVVYAMIPVWSEFFLESESLPQRFLYSNLQKAGYYSKVPTAFPVKSFSGKTLFYFDQKSTGAVPYNNRLTILLRFGGLLLFLLFIHLVAESLARSRIWKGIAFLGFTLIVLRLIIYQFPDLLNLRQFELLILPYTDRIWFSDRWVICL